MIRIRNRIAAALVAFALCFLWAGVEQAYAGPVEGENGLSSENTSIVLDKENTSTERGNAVSEEPQSQQEMERGNSGQTDNQNVHKGGKTANQFQDEIQIQETTAAEEAPGDKQQDGDLLPAEDEKAKCKSEGPEETEANLVSTTATVQSVGNSVGMSAASTDEMSAAASNSIADGVYLITTVLSGAMRLEIGGASQSNGAGSNIYADNWTAAQRWRITSLENGFYKLMNVASGKYLDVSNGKAGNGARVQQYAWNGTKAQQWAIDKTSTGYKLYSALSSTYVLDVSWGNAKNGTAVQLYRSNDTKAQRWSLTKSEPVLPNGLYTATASVSGRALDVSGGSVYSSANVQQYDKNGTMAQSFYLSYNSDNGYYTVIGSASGLVLDVSGGENRNGANAQMYAPNNTAAQRWAIAKNSDGTYTLHSAIGGRVLDVSGGSKNNKANIQTWASNGTPAQKWTIVSAGTWSIPEGVYNIVTAVNQINSIAVQGSSRTSGANVLTQGTATTSWAQKWVFAKASDGYYTIRDLNSRMMLDVNGGVAKSGTNLLQYTQNGSNAQLWKPELASGGIIFRSKLNSSIVLDVSGGSKNAGANIQVYSSNNTAAQKFRLINISAIDDVKVFSVLNIGVEKVLDVDNASTSDGAAVQLYTPNGTGAQKFRAISAGGSKYYLQNTNSQKYLDVDTKTKTKIQQLSGKSGLDKQWVLTLDYASGAFTVKSAYTGQYLDGTSGTLSLKAQSSNDAQKFALQPNMFKLFLDAGHIVGADGYDSGAVGNGYTEAQLTSDLTDRIYKICVNE